MNTIYEDTEVIGTTEVSSLLFFDIFFELQNFMCVVSAMFNFIRNYFIPQKDYLRFFNGFR